MKFPGATSLLNRLPLLAAVAALTACNSEPAPDAAPKVESKRAAAAKVATPADALAKMTRAVGNGKPGAAVDIRYDILAKPTAGQPVEVDVALVPGPGVDSLEATFSGMDGITLAGSLSASFASVKAGEPYKHTLSLLPDRNGVFYITVAVNAKSGDLVMGRSFSLPFVVGTAAVQQKAAPEKDAGGQAVQVMQATEKPAR